MEKLKFMAFDRNNPTDLLALKNEVNNDPLSLGYAAVITDTVKLIGILNDPSKNTEGQTGNDFVTARRLIEVLFPLSLSSQDQFTFQLLFAASNELNDDLSEFKALIVALSTPIATAVNAIIRSLSRAEVLFANDNPYGIKEKVLISSKDWTTARDS